MSIWILFLMILAAVLAFVSVYWYIASKKEPDYYLLFIAGFLWFIIGIPLASALVSLVGIVFIIVGAVRYKRWHKHKRHWNKLKKGEKVVAVIFITVLILLLIGVAAVFLLKY